MSQSASLDKVRMAAQAAEDKKGEDIAILDVRGDSSLTDYFLFISGSSHIHIRAIEDAIRESLKSTGAVLARTDGQRGHLWRALDYGSFIIHIMDKKTREFYSMERLWERARPINFGGAAPKLVVPRRKKKSLRNPKNTRKTSPRRKPKPKRRSHK